MRNIEKLIDHVISAMEERLAANSEKPSWEGMSFQELKRLADAEVLEHGISLYIFENQMCDRIKALKAMRHEASDVINFYGMMIEKIDDILKESKNGRA